MEIKKFYLTLLALLIISINAESLLALRVIQPPGYSPPITDQGYTLPYFKEVYSFIGLSLFFGMMIGLLAYFIYTRPRSKSILLKKTTIPKKNKLNKLNRLRSFASSFPITLKFK